MNHYKIFINTSILIIISLVLYTMGKWTIPFIIGIILAYCFHYPAKILTLKLKFSSTVSASIIVGLLVSIFCIISIFLGPPIHNAILILFNKVSILINNSTSDSINEFIRMLLLKLGINKTVDIGSGIQNWINDTISKVPQYLLNFLNTGKSIVYIIIFMFMTPIITFYLLKDWEKFSKCFLVILRKLTSNTIGELLININNKLGDYIKGQLLICCILSVLYSFCLSIIGVEEALVCGLFSGFISIAPFFGPCIGLGTTLAMCLDDFVFYQYYLTIGLYIIIPFIDSNFITPKLIGDKLGIPPFWMLFSICATMSILGTIGMFLSVPLTVIFSTVCKIVMNKKI